MVGMVRVVARSAGMMIVEISHRQDLNLTLAFPSDTFFFSIHFPPWGMARANSPLCQLCKVFHLGLVATRIDPPRIEWTHQNEQY